MKMRLGILGTRGIPANYGGFETFAEELSTRLVLRGHTVTVFCRSHYLPAEWKRKGEYRGVKLKAFPSIRHKYLDTTVHTLISASWAALQSFDAILICNAANGFCCPLLSLGGVATWINLDGIERHRKKWGWAGKAWYLLSERLSTRLADGFISDARVIQQYYRDRYHIATEYIPYGFTDYRTLASSVLERLGLRSRNYYLYTSRLEPENNAHVVIRAYALSGSRMPLIIVGDAPYAHRYIECLKGMSGPGVIFTGAIYGADYYALQSNAWAYIQATEVGGTHPALLEGMGYGNLVFANDTPENQEVLSDTGYYYKKNDAGDLARLFQETEGNEILRTQKGESAHRRVGEHYDWEKVTDSYERLFSSTFG